MDYAGRFKKGFKILTYSRNSYQVWDDLMELFAVEISNCCTKNIPILKDVWEKREKRFIETAKKYNEKERTRIIPQMFTLMVLELEKNPEQDFLGKMFMELEISNSNAGQFFTPYSVCQAMAQITLQKKDIKKLVKEKGFFSIYEPSCGAGANIIASVNECRKMFKRLIYQNHIYFMAQDLDERVARMCYIQLSLLGVAGIVKVGNTITDPEFRVTQETAGQYYFTPMWFSDVWTMRRFFHSFDIAMNKTEINKMHEK